MDSFSDRIPASSWIFVVVVDKDVTVDFVSTFIIPPANFVCGGVYCFHVVRACVCVRACVRVCVRPSIRPSVRNVLFP